MTNPQLESATSNHPQAAEDGLVARQLLAQTIRERFMSSGFKPPMLPDIAMRLVSLTQDPDATIKGFTDLLSTDPVLTAQVMRIARSPLYATGVEIGSLRTALVRLGMITVRNIVLAASLNSRIFRNPNYTEAMESLQRHCMATAVAARLVSRYTGLFEEHAFLGGLMHDIGIAAVIAVLDDVSAIQLSPDVEAELIFEVHQELGGVLLQHWGLPLALERIVANHHLPPPTETGVCPIATVCLADALADATGAHITGLGTGPFPGTDPEIIHELRVRCGLDDDALWVQLQEETVEMLGAFDFS
ncbi:MAG: HDOD domain-containing protein [Myxococcota bacterium]